VDSLAAAVIASPAAAHASVWDENEDAAGERNNELCQAIEAIGKSITARPIASLSDIVDRAILAAWACQPHGGKLIADDVGGLQGGYIMDVLALAGIRPEQCNAELVTA
jgi:hypothetical protein